MTASIHNCKKLEGDLDISTQLFNQNIYPQRAIVKIKWLPGPCRYDEYAEYHRNLS